MKLDNQYLTIAVTTIMGSVLCAIYYLSHASLTGMIISALFASLGVLSAVCSVKIQHPKSDMTLFGWCISSNFDSFKLFKRTAVRILGAFTLFHLIQFYGEHHVSLGWLEWAIFAASIWRFIIVNVQQYLQPPVFKDVNLAYRIEKAAAFLFLADFFIGKHIL